MNYQQVCLDAIGYTLPEEVWTSDDLERRLSPVYQRLRLPAGRLELMTGIRERRFWKPGTLPGDISQLSANAALEAAELPRELVGALIHGSVCRDHLEPATACRVHHGLGLPPACAVYDTSNACLGLLNGAVQAANMIELGQIKAAVVVGTEGGRQLVETTIEHLNRDPRWTRQSIKLAVASLTIGSASCALVLTHRSISRTGNLLQTAVMRAHTEHHQLCQSGQDEAAAEGMRPLMNTDSERLMRHGIETGAATFDDFLAASGWQRPAIDASFCHQVGSTHRKLMLESLELSPERDFTTFEWLGNTGAAALPVTLAIGLQREDHAGRKLALLGIGSGINCVMCGVRWNETRVAQARL